jgi:hypothetical protein
MIMSSINKLRPELTLNYCDTILQILKESVCVCDWSKRYQQKLFTHKNVSTSSLLLVIVNCKSKLP